MINQLRAAYHTRHSKLRVSTDLNFTLLRLLPSRRFFLFKFSSFYLKTIKNTLQNAIKIEESYPTTYLKKGTIPPIKQSTIINSLAYEEKGSKEESGNSYFLA